MSARILVPGPDSTRRVSTELGAPKHRAPAAVKARGLVEGGLIAVNPRTVETKYANVRRRARRTGRRRFLLRPEADRNLS